MKKKKKVQIVLNDWDYTCGDGCCYNYGVEIIVDGELLEEDGSNPNQLLEAVLNKLGYEVELINCYNNV